jgi:hypothetical protein
MLLKKSKTIFSKFVQVTICFYLFLSVSQVVVAQNQSTSQKIAKEYIENRGEVIISFKKPNSLNLNDISKYMSIDKILNDSIVAYVNEDGLNKFLLLQIPFNIISPPTILDYNSNKSHLKSDGWHNHYPSYDEYVSLMEEFASKYPNICVLQEFGKTTNGKKMLALKISDNPTVKEVEPVMFYSSSIHGDEIIGYILMLRLIDTLLTSYNSSPQIQQLINNVEIWINPLANPDGTYFLSDTSVIGAKRFNSNNIDLNRNFPNIEDPNWESKLREIETTNMMSFMDSIKLVLSANFHGGAEVVNYPWDTWEQLHPDNNWFIHISRMYADTVHSYSNNGYFTFLNNGITNGYNWYYINSGRQDYANYVLHAREVTIELSDNKMPDESEIEYYWLANKKSLLDYIGQVLTGFTGVVTDSITGIPICARIQIENHDNDSSCVYSDISNGVFYRLIQNGNYSVIIDAEGYTKKIIPVSVEKDNLTQYDISLSPIILDNPYPNPFTNQLNLFANKIGTDIELDFFTMYGQLVKSINQKVLNSGIQTFDVSDITSGIYVLQVKIGNQTKSLVVIKN